MKDKQVEIRTISKLPEDASMAEIAEELQIIVALRKGKADVKAGRVRPHVRVSKMFKVWNNYWAQAPRVA